MGPTFTSRILALGLTATLRDQVGTKYIFALLYVFEINYRSDIHVMCQCRQWIKYIIALRPLFRVLKYDG